MYVIETQESGGGADAFEGSTAKLVYMVQLEDAETETDLRSYMASTAPLTVEALSGVFYNRQSIATQPKEALIYRVEVNYVQAKPKQFSFQTGGGSEKVEYSRETMAWFDELGRDLPDTPDFHQGINVTKSSVEGITIRTANFEFKVTKSWALDDIDDEYLELLENLTSCMNQDDYTLTINGKTFTFRPYELLFLGADGQFTTDQRIEITYSFAVSRGIFEDDDLTWKNVGAIEVTEKGGWDLAWVYSVETEDSVTKTMVRRPAAVYIERVYLPKDFERLRLDE